MEYTLKNTDRPVLTFDEEFSYIQVLDNDFLPWRLKDFIKSSSHAKNLKEALVHVTEVRDFLSSRTLNLSREHAKVILNVAALPQSIDVSEKLKIVYACRALNMEDNFWLEAENENLAFSDVSLRKKHLAETSYDIAILGRHISATRNSLVPDLMSGGLFPKYWHREGSVIELWKTDRGYGLNSECEVKASAILKDIGVDCVSYRKEERDGRIFSVCRCMTDDATSLVKARDMERYCLHQEISFTDFMEPFIKSFSNMAVCDYVLGNTDRHNENWGFSINNATNTIKAFFPLYDLNQALMIDKMGNSHELDSLIYEPCSMTFADMIKKHAPLSDVYFAKDVLPPECRKRWESVMRIREMSIHTLS